MSSQESVGSDGDKSQSPAEPSIPFESPKTLEDLSSEVVIQMLQSLLPELPENVTTALDGVSNQRISQMVQKVGNMLAEAISHVEKPNSKSMVHLTPLEATAFYGSTWSQAQSLIKVQNDARIQDEFILMQARTILGLEQHVGRLETKLEEMLWYELALHIYKEHRGITSSSSFGIYGQLIKEPPRSTADLALLQAKFELETRKCQLLRSRLDLTNVVNNGALNYIDFLMDNITSGGKVTYLNPPETIIFHARTFLDEKEAAAINNKKAIGEYYDYQSAHAYLKAKSDWEFVELLWDTLKTHLGNEATMKILINFFVPLGTMKLFATEDEHNSLKDLFSVIKGKTATEILEEMDNDPIRYAEGIKDLNLAAAFKGTLHLTGTQPKPTKEPSASETDEQPSGNEQSSSPVASTEHAELLHAWQKTVGLFGDAQLAAWAIRNEYVLHMDKCKTSAWVNEIFDFVFDQKSNRTGLKQEEKVTRIKKEVKNFLGTISKNQRLIETLQREKKALKDATRSVPTPTSASISYPLPRPASQGNLITNCLENDRYNRLSEQLKSTQLQLEAEQAKGERLTTSSRLAMEGLERTSESRIKALEAEAESAHRETREFDEKLSVESVEHAATQAALTKSKVKISGYQEANRVNGPKFKEMKIAYEEQKEQFQLLRTNEKAEEDRRNAAVRQATAQSEDHISSLQRSLADVTAERDDLRSNEKALSSWKDQVATQEQARKATVAELDKVQDKLGTVQGTLLKSEKKRVAAEAEVSRLRELFAKFTTEVASPTAK
ncbi:hypothetical protein VTL71DRAFT_7553 [Oculimacula yallundae]|uniref:Uncharacterized protein n=1 Tax=Oculimacula yallundae TaxID=86028 RepID=A0ABR4BUG1_9HELO